MKNLRAESNEGATVRGYRGELYRVCIFLSTRLGNTNDERDDRTDSSRIDEFDKNGENIDSRYHARTQVSRSSGETLPTVHAPSVTSLITVTIPVIITVIELSLPTRTLLRRTWSGSMWPDFIP